MSAVGVGAGVPFGGPQFYSYAPLDLDNQSAAPEDRESFSETEFTTLATTVVLTGYNTITAPFAAYADLAVYIDGVLDSHHTMPLGTSTVTLHLDGASHVIRVRNGPRWITGTAVLTCVLTAVAANAPVTMTAYSAPNHRLVIFGDSIAEGWNAPPVTEYGGLNVLRDALPADWRVVNASKVSQTWYYETYSAPVQAALAARLAGYCDGTDQKIIWLQAGYQDWANAYQTAAEWAADVAAVCALINGLDADIHIFAQSPALTGTEVDVNDDGETIGDYRTALAAAVAALSYVTYVDGATEITMTLAPDGIHGTQAGQAEYGATALAALTKLRLAGSPTLLLAGDVTCLPAAWESSGTATIDFTQGTAGYQPAATGGHGLAFDGVDNQMASASDLTALFGATGAWSLRMLIRAVAITLNGTGLDGDTVLEDTAAEFGIVLKTGGGSPTLTVGIWDASYKYIVAPFSTGVDHIVAIDWDGANMNLAVDGTAVAPVAMGTIDDLTGTLVMGAQAGLGRPANVTIRDVVADDAAFSAADAAAIYWWMDYRRVTT